MLGGKRWLLKPTCVGLSVLIWQLWPVSYGTYSNEMRSPTNS